MVTELLDIIPLSLGLWLPSTSLVFIFISSPGRLAPLNLQFPSLSTKAITCYTPRQWGWHCSPGSCEIEIFEMAQSLHHASPNSSSWSFDAALSPPRNLWQGIHLDIRVKKICAQVAQSKKRKVSEQLPKDSFQRSQGLTNCVWPHHALRAPKHCHEQVWTVCIGGIALWVHCFSPSLHHSITMFLLELSPITNEAKNCVLMTKTIPNNVSNNGG